MFSPSSVNVICFDQLRGADQARCYAGKHGETKGLSFHRRLVSWASDGKGAVKKALPQVSIARSQKDGITWRRRRVAFSTGHAQVFLTPDQAAVIVGCVGARLQASALGILGSDRTRFGGLRLKQTKTQRHT